MRTRVKAGWGAGLLLSVVTATILTVIQFSDVWVDATRPVMGRAAPVSIRVPYGAVQHPERWSAYYDKHHNFVPAGTILRESNPGHRTAVAYELQRRPATVLGMLGAWSIVLTLCLALATYLRTFSQSRLRMLRPQVGIFAMITGLFLVTKVQLLFSQLSEFWIPVAVVPLWVATTFDRRTALVVTVVTAFLLASLLRFDLLVLGVLLVHGCGSILLFLDRKRTRSMLISGPLAGLSAAAMLVAMMLTLEGRFDLLADLQAGGASRLFGCVGAGILGGALGALMRAPAERLVGHVPRERLHDLTDLEQPLLKHMAQHAPGSWEHSRAMANLAEQAASAIGVDALLVRVGAYYHDLGKSVRPKYFVENLGPTETSPHGNLSPYESAKVIRAHVEEGTKILRDGGIPEPVVEFAYTHHGTQVVEFFWNRCKEASNPDGYTEEDFRYPGMKPQTKETAILMLVDSIEAASRTIDPPDREQFEMMVQRIVFTKLQSGQLDDCGLSTRDMNVIVTRMADTLVNMNHHRIKYPWQAKKAEEFGVPSRAVSQVPAEDTRPSGQIDRRRMGGQVPSLRAVEPQHSAPEAAEPESGEPESGEPESAQEERQSGEDVLDEAANSEVKR
jgi:putative nucleotidyltransferase with HDIG domain